MFYAHSTERSDRSDWQSLSDHLIRVGELAAERAQRFGAPGLARLAGRLHDLGKYSLEFQARLDGSAMRVDHATAGAQVAVDHYNKHGYLLAYPVAGHHAGLPNGRDDGARSSLKTRLSLHVPELDPVWKEEVPLDRALSPPNGFEVREGRTIFQTSFLIRMVFSCLVDADYRDTEAFYGGAEREQEATPELTTLRAALDDHLSQFEVRSSLDRERADVLKTVRSRAESTTGAFSLTVPTGGGKTLASLAFALDHAIANGLDRVIYVIPFTSIVEQTAAVFREALAPYGDRAVLEHHSGFDSSGDSEAATIDKLRHTKEDWDAPIIVTTAVQFFESLFAARTSACRKLHNIAGSVVILDEAQTLPLKLLRPCVAALDELTRNYRSSIVLCTATQPALEERDDPERSFDGGLRDVTELAPNPARLQAVLRRTHIQWIGTLTDDDLAAEVLADQQVLCIVNNRRHARALYEAISDADGAVLLTTALYPAHRRRVLSDIRQRLIEGRPCRLIATSLIEAGVDVDFPRVLRAEAGLDSIIQAAGRCNREGRANADESQVGVFATANEEWQPPRMLAQYAQAAREVFRHYDDPASLEAIESYFRLLYWQQGKSALDGPDILGQIERGGPEGLPFETVADAFRMIDDGQCPIIIPNHDDRREAQRAIRDLQYAERAGPIARRLQGYTVQVPERAFQRLEAVGAVAPVCPDRFGNQFIQLINDDLYDDTAGLDWQDPTFRDAASNIW